MYDYKKVVDVDMYFKLSIDLVQYTLAIKSTRGNQERDFA
jgi:hypothetical protein